MSISCSRFFFFQAEDGIRDIGVTGVQTCALPIFVPLHLATTFKQDGVGGLRAGYEYARSANPTRTALQEALAALEQGRSALAFASGLAAEDTLLRAVCEPGSHVVLGGDAYRGTLRLLYQVAARRGVGQTPA